MKYNEKRVRKHVSVLETFGVISCSLFIGLLATIKILSGSPPLHTFIDFISALGMLILMSLLTLPITAIIHWVLSMKYDLDEDVYDLAWRDGEIDGQIQKTNKENR